MTGAIGADGLEHFLGWCDLPATIQALSVIGATDAAYLLKHANRKYSEWKRLSPAERKRWLDALGGSKKCRPLDEENSALWRMCFALPYRLDAYERAYQAGHASGICEVVLDADDQKWIDFYERCTDERLDFEEFHVTVDAEASKNRAQVQESGVRFRETVREAGKQLEFVIEVRVGDLDKASEVFAKGTNPG
jgi:hypothetical protein